MDSVDDKIQSVEEIERDLKMVPLGILPHLGEPHGTGAIAAYLVVSAKRSAGGR